MTEEASPAKNNRILVLKIVGGFGITGIVLAAGYVALFVALVSAFQSSTAAAGIASLIATLILTLGFFSFVVFVLISGIAFLYLGLASLLYLTSVFSRSTEKT